MDVDVVDFTGWRRRHRPGERLAGNHAVEPLALGRRDHLGVADAGDVAVGIEDDRRGDDRAGQAAAPHFVAPGDAIEPPAPHGVLEGAHRTDSNHREIPTPNNPTPNQLPDTWDLGVGRWDLLSLSGGLLHPGRLALQVAQEVQLGAADARRPHQVDLGDRRRMQREDALDALAERHLAHRERGARRRRGAARSRSPRRSGCAPCRLRAPSRARGPCRRTSCRARGRHLRLFNQFHRGHCSVSCSFRISSSSARSSSSIAAGSSSSGRRSSVRSNRRLLAPPPDLLVMPRHQHVRHLLARELRLDACSAGNRAARAKTNPLPPTARRPPRPAPAG